MSVNNKKFTTWLWFDNQAEEAANFYVSVFKNGKITDIQRYMEAGKQYHKKEIGSVMVVTFELNGQSFAGLNGGPVFKHSEAVSFGIDCDTQEEIDYYFEKLGEGGDPKKANCGWVGDKYGISWQVVPTQLKHWIGDSDPVKANRTREALFTMKKLDIAALKKAYDGED